MPAETAATATPAARNGSAARRQRSGVTSAGWLNSRPGKLGASSTQPNPWWRNDSATAALEDQRDSYIDQLSKLMDVRVVTSDMLKRRS